jgi:hypothetical protein
VTPPAGWLPRLAIVDLGLLAGQKSFGSIGLCITGGGQARATVRGA